MKNSISRRSFLKAVGALSAAGALAACGQCTGCTQGTHGLQERAARDTVFHKKLLLTH